MNYQVSLQSDNIFRNGSLYMIDHFLKFYHFVNIFLLERATTINHIMTDSPSKVLSIKKKSNSLACSIGEKMNFDWYDTLCWIYIDHLNFFLIIWVGGRSPPCIQVENCVFRVKKWYFQILNEFDWREYHRYHVR